jgi:fatty acid desaturase
MTDLAADHGQASGRSAVEWPTILLAIFIYGGWAALTWNHAAVPIWLLVPAGAWLVAWHSSLQHEVLHGHPTRSRAVNRLFGVPPLALWLPYERYRALHLQHHNDERLTDPLDDPETRYFTAADWEGLGRIGRWLVRAQATLLGRLVIGPFWAIGHFLGGDLRALLQGDRALARVWIEHAMWATAVCAWIALACDMSLALYVAAFVVPGTALMLIRSFAEHRAASEVERRTAIVEGRGPLALLYLYNNLHAAHHERPQVPWYELPRYYRAHRTRLHDDNAGLVYQGYRDVFRRFLIRPHDTPIHPLGRAPMRSPEKARAR